jgi:hypothetical protein
VGAVQVPQQRPGRVAVLDGRGGDHHLRSAELRVFWGAPAEGPQVSGLQLAGKPETA